MPPCPLLKLYQQAFWTAIAATETKKRVFSNPDVYSHQVSEHQRTSVNTNDNRDRSISRHRSRHRQPARHRRLWVVVKYAGNMAKANETVSGITPETARHYL